MAVRAGNAADIYIIAGDGEGTTMTAEACSLVSGTTYQITDSAKRIIDPVATLTVYDGGAPIAAAGYEVSYVSGKVILASAPGGAVTVTGEYLTSAKFAQGTDWSFTFGFNLVNTNTFADTWEEFTATQGRGTVTLGRLFNDEYFHTEIDHANFMLLLYVNQAAGPRYMCIGKLADDTVDFTVSDVGRENVSFTTTGWVDWAAS